MPNIISILLALGSKCLIYERKQIAVLDGYKTTYQLCSYETGQKNPSFKEAVKLFNLQSLFFKIVDSKTLYRNVLIKLEITQFYQVKPADNLFD